MLVCTGVGYMAEDEVLSVSTGSVCEMDSSELFSSNGSTNVVYGDGGSELGGALSAPANTM